MEEKAVVPKLPRECVVPRPIPVDIVENERMTDTREVLADLMATAPLLHTDLEKCPFRELLPHTIPGDCRNLPFP